MRTTPTLGLKLYDGTDSPDLVSGYNASMSALDDARLFRFVNSAPGGTDLNTLTKAGQYTLSAGNTYSNLPADAVLPVCLLVYDRCDTEGTSSCVTQLALPTPSATSGQCMLRSYTTGLKWTDWVPVARPEVAWADVTGKPFDTVGTSLTTSGNVLDLSTAAQASLVPEGGAAGQVLVKSSDTDHDCEWVNPSALDPVYEFNTVTGLTAWLRPFPSTGERWSGPGEVTITANGSTRQYTGNWSVYRTSVSGNAYFQGSGGDVATAHFASLKIDHNANCWAFVMSIKGTEPTFQYVGAINDQLKAMLKRVTTIDQS